MNLTNETSWSFSGTKLHLIKIITQSPLIHIQNKIRSKEWSLSQNNDNDLMLTTFGKVPLIKRVERNKILNWAKRRVFQFYAMTMIVLSALVQSCVYSIFHCVLGHP
jgi:hypothetical protein